MAFSSTTPQDVVRLRMNVSVSGANLGSAARTFKLQFATSTGGPWSDAGGSGSGAVWRGFDNTAVAGGATLPSVLLASSNVAQTYEEFNPSAPNPNSASVGQGAEWDWALEDNSAPSGTYFFRMVEESGTTLSSYTNFPEIVAAAPVFDQQDYRWFTNTDNLTPVTPLAAENTLFTETTQGLVYRLRMNVEVQTTTLPANGQSFKLQYAASTGGPWADVGSIASGETWRGFDNPGVADGTTITTLMAGSTVAATYEEQNPSALNPDQVGVAQRVEWDWVLEPNNAATSISYFFRMVTAAGGLLDTYTRYPEIVTPPALVFSQENYRWYENKNNITPDTPLAVQNTAITDVTPSTVLRLRLNAKLTSADLAADTESFRLQYATSTTSTWTDVGGIGSLETWRGFDVGGGTTDGTPLLSLLLSTSTVAATFEETNPSATNPNAVSINDVVEWDWVVENNAAPTATYFFQMVRSDGSDLDSYVNYPELTTAAPTLTQEDYRWFSNLDDDDVGAPLVGENTPYTDASLGEVLRLRINVLVQDNALTKDSQTFKLQYSVTTTTGPWTDIGGIGTSAIWRGFDNPKPSDGATLKALELSTSNVKESYEESNPSALNPNAVPVGQMGEWDWVVEDNNAPSETRFYFRVVKGDGSLLDGYTNFPQVTTSKPVVAFDDFESGGFSGGGGWLGAWNPSGDVSVRKQGTPKQGQYHMRFRRDTGHADRAVDLSGETTVSLEFWLRADSFEPGDTADLSVSDDGVSFTVIKTWTDADADGVYRFYSFQLNSFAPPLTSTYTIAFDANMDAPNDTFYVDDLKLVGE